MGVARGRRCCTPTVRRSSGPAAGLIAGAVLALTPVAALMFRFNNPDALLVLLLVAAAYCVVRAIETASTRWIALAGCVIGFAFLTKMLQAFLVVPGLGAGLPRRGAGRLWRRIGKLLVGAAAMIVSAGWWVALVEPVAGRLAAVHRRLHRQQPAAAGLRLQRPRAHHRRRRRSAGGGPGGGGPGGRQPVLRRRTPGIGRLFGQSMGTEASWLLPAALIGLAAGCGSPGGRPHRTASAPACCCGAAGCW